MKKITFFAILLLLNFGAYAQFHVTSNYGDIENGTELESGSLDKTEEVKLTVHNDTDSEMKMRLMLVSMDNTDGTSTEMCFGGSCLYGVEPGISAPAPNFNDGIAVIGAGETNAAGDHFWNGNAGTNSDEPVTYEMQFQQLDQSGSVAVDTINFTYTYDPALSVESHEKKFNTKIMNTVVDNGQLGIDTQKPVDIQIYNLLGQQVKQEHLDRGQNNLDVSNLSTQIYLVRFHNAQGQTKTQKIVIK